MQQNDSQLISVLKISVMIKFGYNKQIKAYFGPVDNFNSLAFTLWANYDDPKQVFDLLKSEFYVWSFVSSTWFVFWVLIFAEDFN